MTQEILTPLSVLRRLEKHEDICAKRWLLLIKIIIGAAGALIAGQAWLIVALSLKVHL